MAQRERYAEQFKEIPPWMKYTFHVAIITPDERVLFRKVEKGAGFQLDFPSAEHRKILEPGVIIAQRFSKSFLSHTVHSTITLLGTSQWVTSDTAGAVLDVRRSYFGIRGAVSSPLHPQDEFLLLPQIHEFTVDPDDFVTAGGYQAYKGLLRLDTGGYQAYQPFSLRDYDRSVPKYTDTIQRYLRVGENNWGLDKTTIPLHHS